MASFDTTQLALLWVLVGGLVGLVIGWRKNRIGFGLALGAVLGPLGWLITGYASGRFQECPECSASIPVQSKVCPKCGVSIAKAGQRTARSALKGARR